MLSQSVSCKDLLLCSGERVVQQRNGVLVVERQFGKQLLERKHGQAQLKCRLEYVERANGQRKDTVLKTTK
ncbi:hypothetical protein Aduo_012296 [Ancylostoma duodenale]